MSATPARKVEEGDGLGGQLGPSGSDHRTSELRAGAFKRYERMYSDLLPDQRVIAYLRGAQRTGAARVHSRAPSAAAALASVGRQPKLHYQATPAGIRSYIDWLIAQADVERRRQALWVRQLAIFADEPSTALHVLGRFRSQYLQGPATTDDPPSSPVPGSRDKLIEELLDKQQRIAGGGMLSWLKHAIATFEARARSVAGDGSAQA